MGRLIIVDAAARSGLDVLCAVEEVVAGIDGSLNHLLAGLDDCLDRLLTGLEELGVVEEMVVAPDLYVDA